MRGGVYASVSVNLDASAKHSNNNDNNNDNDNDNVNNYNDDDHDNDDDDDTNDDNDDNDDNNDKDDDNDDDASVFPSKDASLNGKMQESEEYRKLCVNLNKIFEKYFVKLIIGGETGDDVWPNNDGECGIRDIPTAQGREGKGGREMGEG